MIEDAIRDAIIEKFFEPVPNVSTQMVYDPTGSQRMESVVMLTDAPALQIAKAVWAANKEAITSAVMERLDLDAIVEQCSELVTKSVLEKLTKVPNNWSAKPSPSERERMLTKVYDRVAEEFGRQCVEHLRETGGLMGVLETGADND